MLKLPVCPALLKEQKPMAMLQLFAFIPNPARCPIAMFEQPVTIPTLIDWLPTAVLELPVDNRVIEAPPMAVL
jgi:hypothetical protein